MEPFSPSLSLYIFIYSNPSLDNLKFRVIRADLKLCHSPARVSQAIPILNQDFRQFFFLIYIRIFFNFIMPGIIPMTSSE